MKEDNERQNQNRQEDSVYDIYDFESALGQGSFAQVWKAKSKENGKYYAIKQVPVHPLDRQIAFRQAENLKQTENDHIVKYHNAIYDKSQSTLNIVMQLGRGSIRSQMKDKVYTRKELFMFIVQMVSAFLELSIKKIMHLDLKPQNILVSKSSSSLYKICDFGCAQIAVQSKLTKYKNEPFGTFNYLAPQTYLLYKGKMTNTSADVWSLGIILYQMMYKKYPLPTQPNGLIIRKEIEDYFINKKEQKIQYSLGPHTTPDLINIVKKMLQPNPTERPSWLLLKQILQQTMKVDEYYFLNIRKIYFKHLAQVKIFLSMIVLIRKNIEFNPYIFWKDNKSLLDNFSESLLHVSYIYCQKFKEIYQFKFQEYLSEDQIKDLKFMAVNIKLQEQSLSKSKSFSIPHLQKLLVLEKQIFSECKKINKLISMSKQTWESMLDLGIFCQQTMRRMQSKKTCFASGDFDGYGETIKKYRISYGGAC